MNQRYCTKLAMAWSAIVIVLIANSGRLYAEDPLRESLSSVAAQIKAVLQSKDTSSIGLGLIVPKGIDKVASYGRRISEALRAELEHLQINIDDKAKFGLTGKYSVVEKANDVSISITVTIIDDNGDPLNIIAGNINAAKIETEVSEVTEVLLVSHAAIAVEPGDSSTKIRERIRTEQANPSSLSINGDGYLVLKDCGLGLRLREVHPQQVNANNFLGNAVKANSPTAPHFSLKEGHSYAIELKNFRPDGLDLANKVLFDGIDTFVLSDESARMAPNILNKGRRLPKYEYWILNHNSSQLIPGWFKNEKEVSAFQIVPDEKSVAYRLGQPQGIGTIQIISHAAWPIGANPPAANLLLPKRRGGAGQGAAMAVNLKPVGMQVGVILGSISIEYETKK